MLVESMGFTEIFGMLFIVAGILGLALETSAEVLQLPRPALFYSLLIGLCITSFPLLDGIGVERKAKSQLYCLDVFLR